MKYATSKTCSREIDFEVENNIVTSCEFVDLYNLKTNKNSVYHN